MLKPIELINIVTVIGAVAVLIAVIVSSSCSITRSKIKAIAILFSIAGVSCLYSSFLLYGEGLQFASAGGVLIAMLIATAEIILYKRYRKLGTS